MKNKNDSSSKNSIKTLILFCIGVFIIVVISLLYKGFNLVKEGKFHGEHIFVIAVEKKENIELVAFHPVEKKVTYIPLHDKESITESKLRLGVYVEGSIVTDKETYSMNSLLKSNLFNSGTSTGLTQYDIFRLWWMTRGIDDSTGERLEINKNLSEEEIDRIVQDELIDKLISDENKTISIINSSGVPGLGRRLERALENIGGNVINVENGENIQNDSTIVYYGSESKTVKRLESLLNTKSRGEEGQNLSDIIIVLGTDMKSESVF